MTYSKKFYSVYGLSSNREEKEDLELSIKEYNPDSIEIELKNLKYLKQRRAKIILLFIIFFLYVAYCFTVAGPSFINLLLPHFVFFGVWFYLVWSIFQLIKTEKILFCSEFTLQITRERFLSNISSFFIPSKNVFDVAINEVIQDLNVYYILIVRTKGDLFALKPIIPIFWTLKPRVDCLEIIYKHLMRVIYKPDNAR